LQIGSWREEVGITITKNRSELMHEAAGTLKNKMLDVTTLLVCEPPPAVRSVSPLIIIIIIIIIFLVSAGVPVFKEASGLSRCDGKNPSWIGIDSVSPGQVSHMGYDRCLALLPTLTWKLHLARQALQPSWQHLTRWSIMLTFILSP